MIVIDASAMIELLRRGPGAAQIEHLLDDDVLAPDLLVTEVLNTMRRFERAGSDTTPAIELLIEADIDYVPVWPHTQRIWELRHTISPYDACYAAIAEAHRCPLITTDARLGRATGLDAPIIVA